MRKIHLYLYCKIRYGLLDRLNRLFFYPAIRNIIKTFPIQSRDDGLVILSMVSHKDLLMYLLAMKSLDKFLQRGRYEVINDGTLEDKDIALIRRHIEGVRFTDFTKINNTVCPKRGVWERLLYAAELSEQEQVLVVDSDILTQGDVVELKTCLDKNQNFIIGVGQEIGPMLEVWKIEMAKYNGEPISRFDIQKYFDTHLNDIPQSPELKYLKATNGFNGFAKGVITRKLVEEWSVKMENVFQNRWHRWGTEQIMACFMVANYGDTVVLQEPKYGLFYDVKGVNYDEMSVVHFIGTHRFRKGYYAKAARKVIRRLRNGQ